METHNFSEAKAEQKVNDETVDREFARIAFDLAIGASNDLASAPEVSRQLESSGEQYLIDINTHRLRGLSESEAYRLIYNGEGWKVLRNPDAFDNLNVEMIMSVMRERGEKDVVDRYLPSLRHYIDDLK